MRLTLILAWLAGSNTLLMLLIQWYVVTRLGVGFETDALFAGMAIPQLILSVVSSSLAHVLVPLLATTENETAFRRSGWDFFLGIGGLFSVIAAALFLSAAWWVPLLVPGFSTAAQALTIKLTRIQLIGMIFTAAVSVLWSIYHARQKFVWTELSALIANASALLFLALALARFGIAAAAWAMVLRTGLQLAWLLPGLGWRPRGRERAPGKGIFKSPTMTSAWQRLRPLLLGTAYYKTDPLVDRFLTSMSPAGDLSLLYIGQQLYGVVNVIVDKALSAPMVPLLAMQAQINDWQLFRRTYRRRLLIVGGLTIAGYLALVAGGELVLDLLIGRGGISAQNVRSLWWIMVALGGVFVGGAMGQIAATTFYAMGDTRTPTRMSVLTYSVYVPTKIIAFLRFGLPGLAVVTSVYFMLNLALHILLLERFVLPARAQRKTT